ncbi:glycosyltransferase family 33 protein [Serendipita vermifera MAFF 305830]|uniref:Chitobiosyldiphosphodolichol beta-mannosyltransferase n=1 Tax=Serendipita vermifera MAFF 305830 TaxID=933852 RepID=A0A0C2XV53_SERVB|nr:glycosyltransferase family 33 protein [Serendipita vermifera MAFF 305830]
MEYDPTLGWDLALSVQLLLAAGFILFVYRVVRISQRDARTGGPEYRSVAILVLGDIGRSPRMMYHAQSFASFNFQTFIIGYRGSKPLSSLLSMSHVKFLYISEPPKFIAKLPRVLFLLLAPLKVAHQVWSILDAFIFKIESAPQYIIVQNPPTIPSLAIVWLVSRLRGSKVIIDWHNLGYTILAMRLGEKSRIVALAKKFEQTFGRSAYAHLFVTNAMKDFLVKNWDLKGHKVVVHDRPPAHFHQCTPSEIHDLFVRLMPFIDTDLSFFPKFRLPSTTPFTEVVKSPNPLSLVTNTSLLEPRTMPSLRHERPALLITSTSWTPDEDFSMLLEALRIYEAKARACASAGLKGKKQVLPKVLMFVTGKGPLRAHYMREIQRIRDEEKWEWVRCMSLWLEPDDYPRLLGSCDIGISLHSSSSALDLPMKIVDMFGCHLPVCALDFSCLNELVKDGKNGLVFKDAQGLAGHLESLLLGFPDSGKLDQLRASFSAPATSPSARSRHAWGSWDENWDETVKPLVMPQEYVHRADEWLQGFAERKRLHPTESDRSSVDY